MLLPKALGHPAIKRAAQFFLAFKHAEDSLIRFGLNYPFVPVSLKTLESSE